MNSSIRQARHPGSSGRKVIMALALATAISGLSIAPALADRDNEHNRGKHSQREWRGDRDGYDGYRNEHRRPYSYAEPVYVPPPVYYEPRQSPGISFFFPLDLRR